MTLCSGSRLFAQTVYVPLAHTIYDYIDRLESAGVVSRALNNTKPMTRAEIGEILRNLIERAASLNRIELRQLEYYKLEFYEELAEQLDTDWRYRSRLRKLVKSKTLDAVLPDALYANERNFLSYSSRHFSIFWDPLFKRSVLRAQADTLDGAERVNESTNGFVFWGFLGAHAGFFCDIRDTKEWGSRKYPDQFDISVRGLGFVNGYGDHLYHDETVAYLTLHWPRCTIQYGKDANFWGPAFRGSLVLSDFATSYDLIKIQFLLTNFKFTSLLGFLRHYPLSLMGDEQLYKSLAGHRLEWAPAAWLTVGLHETVLYSGRRFEPAYLNPVMFFRSADHYLGDRDNVAMGLDLEVRVLPGIKLYGELFIDDITTTKLGTGFHGNRYAYTLGAHFIDLFGLDNLDLRAEYTRIRPFVYSHRDSLNVYRHFTTTLGHFSGPNSDFLYLGLRFLPHWRLRVTCYFEYNRSGENEPGCNIGRDITRPHGSWDPFYIDFLEGLRSNGALGGARIMYELAHRVFLQADFRLMQSCVDSSQGITRETVNRHEFALVLGVQL